MAGVRQFDEAAAMQCALDVFRRKGFAVRKPNARRSSATIAVAILQPDEILGTLCLTTFGRSLTGEMISQFAPVLTKTAGDIAARCKRDRR